MLFVVQHQRDCCRHPSHLHGEKWVNNSPLLRCFRPFPSLLILSNALPKHPTHMKPSWSKFKWTESERLSDEISTLWPFDLLLDYHIDLLGSFNLLCAPSEWNFGSSCDFTCMNVFGIWIRNAAARARRNLAWDSGGQVAELFRFLFLKRFPFLYSVIILTLLLLVGWLHGGGDQKGKLFLLASTFCAFERQTLSSKQLFTHSQLSPLALLALINRMTFNLMRWRRKEGRKKFYYQTERGTVLGLRIPNNTWKLNGDISKVFFAKEFHTKQLSRLIRWILWGDEFSPSSVEMLAKERGGACDETRYESSRRVSKLSKLSRAEH